MQASWSTAMTGFELSVPRPVDSGSRPSRVTRYRCARASSSLSPVVVCLGSRLAGGWSASSSSVSVARLRSTSGVAVLTSIPSSQDRTHAAA